MTELVAPLRRPAPNRGSKGGRRLQISIRLLDHEYELLLRKADNSGLSAASYLRSVGLGDAGPRARRSPDINLAAIGAATAALNKIGSNINQLAREMNSGTTPHSRALMMALEDVRKTLAHLRTAAGYSSHDS